MRLSFAFSILLVCACDAETIDEDATMNMEYNEAIAKRGLEHFNAVYANIPASSKVDRPHYANPVRDLVSAANAGGETEDNVAGNRQ